MQLAGRVVWITGASDGIGAALAVALAHRGAKLILTARREEKLRDVAARCAGTEVAILPADLLEADPVALAAQAEAALGPVDILVANAGQGQRGTALATQMDVVRRLMELNFFAPVALTRAVVPGMIERGLGRVVVTSSLAGQIGTPMRSSYAASKHAIEGYYEALRAEIHGTGVGVTVVAPGYIDTAISTRAASGDGSAYGRVARGNAEGLSPERCAEAMVKALERDRDHIMIGGREVAGVYVKRWAPWLVRRWLHRVVPADVEEAG